MFRSVTIDPLQKVTNKNFNDFGEFPRGTFDTVLFDLFGRGLWYTGFICTDSGSGQLRVGAGRFYRDGVGYYNDTEGGEALDLLRRAPVANTLWVAIAITGKTEDTDVRPTAFLANSATRDTTARNKPQESRRWAEVSPIVGLPAPEPVKPLGTSDSVIVAWVLLNNAGIVRIEPNDDAVAPSIVDQRAKIADINAWRTGVGSQIDALGSNIAGLTARLLASASQTMVNRIARDIGLLKAQLKLPQDYSSYQNEYYLSNALSDINHVDYLAEVQEGIRFPPAMIQESQLQLLNELNPDVVKVGGGGIFPKYTEVVRLENIGFDRQVNLASFTFDSYEVIQKTMVRERLRVGPWFYVCTNYLYYDGQAKYDEKTRILTLTNGERYEIYPEDAYVIANEAAAGWTVRTHDFIRAKQIWSDGFEEVAYTDTFVNRSTVTGSLCGQTFVAPQDGYISAFYLWAAALADAGDIQCLVLEVPPNGQPDLTKVIGRGTLRRENMSMAYPWNLKLDYPVATTKGQRYAFVVSSPSNHILWQTKNNKLSNGSFFYITDGAWAMGDPVYDLAFQIAYCQFERNRLEIQLQPMQLAGGIANVDITQVKYVPPGCSAEFFGQFNGVWKSLQQYQPDAASPFIGQPPLVPLKIVLQGTYDKMPVFGLGSQSRLRTFRPRSDFRHISTERTQPTGAPAKTVVVETRLENWRGVGFHTHGVRLRYGTGFNTFLTPSVVEDEKVPEDTTGATIMRRSIFVFPTAQTSYKIQQEGTTNNVLTTFHVAERFDVATTT